MPIDSITYIKYFELKEDIKFLKYLSIFGSLAALIDILVELKIQSFSMFCLACSIGNFIIYILTKKEFRAIIFCSYEFTEIIDMTSQNKEYIDNLIQNIKQNRERIIKESRHQR